jgi:hypothetical protein
MSPFHPDGDLAGTPGSFSPSVRRRRCSQAGGDVLRQEAAVLRYASRVIRIMRAQKFAPFPGRAPDVLARLHITPYEGSLAPTEQKFTISSKIM